MKDKEKQIEEMAIELIHGVGNWLNLGQTKSVVNLLLVSGWIKPDEDSVVLSKAEYNDLKGLEKHFDDYLIKEIKDTRKETAEKIANRLIEMFSTAMGVCSGCALQHDKAKNPTAREFQFGKYKGFEVAIKEVKELAKQFGVEIKE